jgi:hypothetical protein
VAICQVLPQGSFTSIRRHRSRVRSIRALHVDVQKRGGEIPETIAATHHDDGIADPHLGRPAGFELASRTMIRGVTVCHPSG